jgi:hypothetical protein
LLRSFGSNRNITSVQFVKELKKKKEMKEKEISENEKEKKRKMDMFLLPPPKVVGNEHCW